ncbi:hypothetical protein JCM3765_002494 [Sporobolomyces pararoseus]
MEDDRISDDNLRFQNSLHSPDSPIPSRSRSFTSRPSKKKSLDCFVPSFESGSPPSHAGFDCPDQLELDDSFACSQSLQHFLPLGTVKIGNPTIGSQDVIGQGEGIGEEWSSRGETFGKQSRSCWKKENPGKRFYRDRDRVLSDVPSLGDYY